MIVSAVMFPILALVIICAVVLIRKSQGYVRTICYGFNTILQIFPFAALFWLQENFPMKANQHHVVEFIIKL